MRQKIFRNTSLLVIIAVFLSFVLIALVSYGQFFDEMKQGVQNEARYVQTSILKMGEDYLGQDVANASTSRITLVNADGTVVYDSAATGELENHKDRPEIQAALTNGVGEATRLSATLGETTYYYALRLSDGLVLRMSHTVDSVFKTMMSSLTLIALIMIGVVLLTLFLTGKFTKRLVAPINNIDLEHPMEQEVYEELSPLLRRIQGQNEVIQNQVKELKANHQEYLAITDHMKDGLIVTNQKVVLSVNQAAQKIYQVNADDCVGQNILVLSRDEELKEAWEAAIKGQSSKKQMEKGGRTYELLANPVFIDQEPKGAVILVLDVTEQQQSEQMRREFSANVSHELKTPLMSISGYAELIENRMVKEADIPGFAGRIHSEADRLTALVEDIIRLSQLDEASESTQTKEDLDLYEVAKEVCAQLEMQAQKKKITLDLEGESATIYGVRQIVHEMLYNICDNAIKYNHQEGQVHVLVKNEGAHVCLTVQDTGIGIPAGEQERIFERFYRVDKSHSKETGGTGLGLSIVKHGAALHDAEITVDSKEGEGTIITLTFQKGQELLA